MLKYLKKTFFKEKMVLEVAIQRATYDVGAKEYLYVEVKDGKFIATYKEKCDLSGDSDSALIIWYDNQQLFFESKTEIKVFLDAIQKKDWFLAKQGRYTLKASATVLLKDIDITITEKIGWNTQRKDIVTKKENKTTLSVQEKTKHLKGKITTIDSSFVKTPQASRFFSYNYTQDSDLLRHFILYFRDNIIFPDNHQIDIQDCFQLFSTQLLYKQVHKTVQDAVNQFTGTLFKDKDWPTKFICFKQSIFFIKEDYNSVIEVKYQTIKDDPYEETKSPSGTPFKSVNFEYTNGKIIQTNCINLQYLPNIFSLPKDFEIKEIWNNTIINEKYGCNTIFFPSVTKINDLFDYCVRNSLNPILKSLIKHIQTNEKVDIKDIKIKKIMIIR